MTTASAASGPEAAVTPVDDPGIAPDWREPAA